MDGIGGTDGVHKSKMIVKKPHLYVCFSVHADNGMVMSADGFYEGSYPITMPMIIRIKSEITTSFSEHLSQVKTTDQQGKIIMGVPKPKVRAVEIKCVCPAELEEEVPVN